MLLCPQCGNADDSSAQFCSRCGYPLSRVAREAPASQPEQSDPDLSGSLQELYRVAIGPRNQDYYLNQFSRFDDNGKAGVSWHWPAFFVTFYWFLYRKMWLNALVYFLLPWLAIVPLGIAAGLAGDSGNAIFGIGYLAFIAGFVLLPPLFANALYYRHCRRKIAAAGMTPHDIQTQLRKLARKGGTSSAPVIVFALLVLSGMLAAIAIPAYQAYTTRVVLADALTAGDVAAAAVGRYYSVHQEIPDSLAESGFTAPLPPSVQEIAVDNQNGIIRITMAAAPVAGKALLLLPSVNASNQVVWKCISREISRDYLPPHCRQ